MPSRANLSQHDKHLGATKYSAGGKVKNRRTGGAATEMNTTKKVWMWRHEQAPNAKWLHLIPRGINRSIMGASNYNNLVSITTHGRIIGGKLTSTGIYRLPNHRHHPPNDDDLHQTSGAKTRNVSTDSIRKGATRTRARICFSFELLTIDRHLVTYGAIISDLFFKAHHNHR